MTPEQFRAWFLLGRDVTCAVAGISLVVYEAVLRSGAERPTLIVGYFALIGLPFVLRAEDKEKGG